MKSMYCKLWIVNCVLWTVVVAFRLLFWKFVRYTFLKGHALKCLDNHKATQADSVSMTWPSFQNIEELGKITRTKIVHPRKKERKSFQFNKLGFTKVTEIFLLLRDKRQHRYPKCVRSEFQDRRMFFLSCIFLSVINLRLKRFFDDYNAANRRRTWNYKFCLRFEVNYRENFKIFIYLLLFLLSKW